MEPEKPNSSLRIPPPGTLRKTRASGSSSWAVPCPCTWSPSLETYSSSWPSSQTHTFTLPCTSSSVTCRWWTSFSSTTVPKMLVKPLNQSKAIPFAGCLAQMHAFHLFGTMDSFLLAVMAIDRFMAIVHPLRYLAIMSPRVCGLLVVGSG